MDEYFKCWECLYAESHELFIANVQWNPDMRGYERFLTCPECGSDQLEEATLNEVSGDE